MSSKKKVGLHKSNIKATKKARLYRSLSGDITIFMLLLIVGVFMVLPFVYAIIQSLKPMNEQFIFPPRLYVVNPTLENYIMLFKLVGNLWVPFSRYAFNSIFISVAVTGLHVVIASTAAYPLAKAKFPGSKFLFEVIILALLFTSQVTGIMQYIILAKMHFVDTYFSLILPYVSAPLGLFLMKQFMSQVPDAVIEAARVDGSGSFKTCWLIVMPAVKPAWLTLIIFSFQSAWGITGYQFIYNESLKTLPTVLGQIASSGIARAGVGTAASVILMLPPVIVFILTQSNVLETMTHSGIKE